MRRAILLWSMTFAAVAGLSAAARQSTPSTQPPAQQAPPAPVFRTGVELVRLDVRVTDGDGRPIEDLRADEVEVVETGETRPVLLFQHIEQPAGSYAEVAQRTIASEVSTNQGSPRGHLYVLVFDQSHITIGNEQRARRAAERFLRTRVRPGDRVALYAIPGPGPQIEFTGDASRAIRALPWIRGSREEGMVGVIGPMRVSDAYEIARGNQDILGRYLDRSQTDSATSDSVATVNRAAAARQAEDPAVVRRQIFEDARTVTGRADGEARRFLQQLADVVRTLRDVDGRKSLVLFSEGFEIDNVRHDIEQIAAAAAQSYCVVYALDLNARDQGLQEMQTPGSRVGSEILSRLESLGSLAAETDGVLFNDASPQADRILNQISESSQDYYLVGFAPSEAGLRDRTGYRRIKVQVTRPGVRVSARSGYTVGTIISGADRRRTIDAALRAPFSQQGLRVEYTTYVIGGSGTDTQRVIVSLQADLPVASGEARPADVVFAVRDVGSGRMAANGSDTIPLPQSARPGATTGTGLYRVQFELPPGVYLMRAVVREPGGLLGSADRRFTVRALSSPGVTAGDLIVGSSDIKGLPVRATVHSLEAISAVMEVYGRLPSQLEGLRVDVDVLPFGGSTAVTSGRGDLQTIRSAARGSTRGVRIDIPVQGIAPGEYVVRATVRGGRETVAERLRDVAIVAGPRPEPPLPDVLSTPDPSGVLQGDLARQWTARLQKRSTGSPLDAAAQAAGRGDWTEVERALSLVADTNTADAQGLLGLLRFARKDYAGAIPALKRSVDADSRDAMAIFVLGWAHAGAGDDRSAISAWRAAIVADPTVVSPYLAAIDAYLRLGQPDLARQVVQAGLTALPDSLELRDRLSRLERR